MIEPPYTHRRTWPDTDREDYVIRCEGHDVGLIARSAGGQAFVWSIYVNGHVPQVDGVPISGVAVDLETAAAEFKTAHERMRAKAWLPQPQ